MNPKLIFFQDFYINMNYVVSILLKPDMVRFIFVDASSKTFVDFDESEYEDLQENLQSLM